MRNFRLHIYGSEYHRQLLRKSDISREAKKRLRWMDHHARHNNASFTCRYFGISRETFYRWKRRFNPRNLSSLENRSCRPHQVRQPTWTLDEIKAVAAIRQEFPKWGKEKLHRLLAKYKSIYIPVSRIGRILKNLKENGKLIEGTYRMKTRKGRTKRPYAVRKPKDYKAINPGDIVQIDTLEIRPFPGRKWFQFTARDMVSRWDVLHLAGTNSSLSASEALKGLLKRAPFKVKAVQVDGGSEYMALFEAAVQELGIKMFVLPPRSPKLNGHVERAQRTHTEEFYQTRVSGENVEEVREELLEWEYIYNEIRPHQSLGYKTPSEFLEAFERAS